MLDFARPIRFELVPVDLNALCRESAAAAQATPGAAVRLDLDPSLGVVRTDAERLRVALVNLIVNARHAVEAQGRDAVAAARVPGGARTPPGVANPVRRSRRRSPIRPGRRCRSSTRPAGDRVAIVVADAGVGIDQADLPRVFNPYFTTKRGGTGLGLPIAKNIVEGLGGSLVVASAPGRGTEMRLDLPYTPPDR